MIRRAFEKTFTKNDNGVDIVMCCASCRHHQSDGSKDRTCKCKIQQDDEGNCAEHDIAYLCSGWRIDDKVRVGAKVSLKTLKLVPSGHVKRKEYFEFCAKHGYTFKEGREPFEREYGSIYMDGRNKY